MLEAKVYSFEEMLQNEGYLVYTSVGKSMLPFLRERRDIIIIRPVTSQLKKYDIVLYKRNNMYILHRILRVTPSGYIIAGDNNTFVETDIKKMDILGVMTQVIRNKKEITPHSIPYRLYIHLWCDFYSVRMLILRIISKVRYYQRRFKRN